MNAPSAYLVLDTETTGLGQNARIIELAAIKVVDERIVDQRSQLIDPKVWIPSYITQLTGISNDMVRGKATMEQVLPRFLLFAQGLPLVGHNISFDLGMLTQEGLRLHMPVPFSIAADTLHLSRRLLPHLPSHRLQDMAQYFHIEVKAAHRALADVYTTQALYMRLLELDARSSLGDSH